MTGTHDLNTTKLRISIWVWPYKYQTLIKMTIKEKKCGCSLQFSIEHINRWQQRVL